MPKFDWLAFHPNFELHQEEGGRVPIPVDEVEDAWFAGPTIAPNKKGLAGRYLMRGALRNGAPFTVVLCGTDLDTCWLAYTAWRGEDPDY